MSAVPDQALFAVAPGDLQDPPPPGTPPRLSPWELARWAWRQLTSMRVALVLLFLLALATVPGSLVPQRNVDPLAVADLIANNPARARWYERFSLFDVYSAPWFAAIYLLLFVSLVGCVLPRAKVHVHALRTPPPPAPRRLDRLPQHREATADGDPDEVRTRAAAVLRARRFRVAAGDDWVAGERGYLRETGNLLFHLALLLVLVAVAVGSLYGYRATVVVPEGQGFANSVIQYDSLQAGSRFAPSSLPPFALTVDRFTMSFRNSGPSLGVAADFAADVTLVPEPGASPEQHTIRVNHPLTIDGTSVHLLNPGYAPRITVRDGAGTVLFAGAVPFLPQDETFSSVGVVKVPVPTGEGTGTEPGQDIGIEGIFLPTAVLDEQGPRSVFPEARNPALFLTAYAGDLGLDDRGSQNVYQLDKDALTQLEGEDGTPFRAGLSVGQAATLPDGLGSVTFDGYVTWVNLQVGRNAGKDLALVGAVLAVAGLMGSLFVRRRRVWVRVTAGEPRDDGRATSVVRVAGLDRAEGAGDLAAEVDDLVARVAREGP